MHKMQSHLDFAVAEGDFTKGWWHWCHKKLAPPIFGTPIPIFLGLRDSPFDLRLENWHPQARTMTVIEVFPYSDVSS